MYNNTRPVITVPRTTLEKFMDILSCLFLIAIYSYIVYIWNDLPAKVPSHFNALGEPDNWSGKGSVLISPIVGTFLFVAFSILRKFPHVFNYPVKITKENAENMYITSRKMLTVLNLIITFFFAIGTWEIIQVSFGKEGLGVWYLPALLIAIFGTIGYYMYRLFRLR